MGGHLFSMKKLLLRMATGEGKVREFYIFLQGQGTVREFCIMVREILNAKKVRENRQEIPKFGPNFLLWEVFIHFSD